MSEIIKNSDIYREQIRHRAWELRTHLEQLTPEMLPDGKYVKSLITSMGGIDHLGSSQIISLLYLISLILSELE